MIACPDCGKEVSEAAPACPHCGRPMTPATGTPRAEPVRVKTSEDSALTRSRGCADLIIWPILLVVLLLMLLLAFG